MKSHVGCSQNSRLIAIIIHGATLETIIFCFVILLVSYVTCVENNSCAISCVISPLCLVLHFFGTFFWCSLLCLFLQKPYPFFPQPFFFWFNLSFKIWISSAEYEIDLYKLSCCLEHYCLRMFWRKNQSNCSELFSKYVCFIWLGRSLQIVCICKVQLFLVGDTLWQISLLW